MRDAGLIVDYVSRDVYRGGVDNAILAGTAYWTGLQNAIGGELTQCLSAIAHIGVIMQSIVTNTTVSPIYQGAYPQVYDYALTNGGIANNRIINSIGTIENIIEYEKKDFYFSAELEKIVFNLIDEETWIKVNDTPFVCRIEIVSLEQDKMNVFLTNNKQKEYENI